MTKKVYQQNKKRGGGVFDTLMHTMRHNRKSANLGSNDI